MFGNAAFFNLSTPCNVARACSSHPPGTSRHSRKPHLSNPPSCLFPVTSRHPFRVSLGSSLRRPSFPGVLYCLTHLLMYRKYLLVLNVRIACVCPHRVREALKKNAQLVDEMPSDKLPEVDFAAVRMHAWTQIPTEDEFRCIAVPLFFSPVYEGLICLLLFRCAYTFRCKGTYKLRCNTRYVRLITSVWPSIKPLPEFFRAKNRSRISLHCCSTNGITAL